VTIGANLSASSQQTVTVQYTISDGTAKAGKDYIVPGGPSGTITIQAGSGGGSTTVTLLDDNAVNEGPSETFHVTLSNPSGAILGDSTGTVTIREDSDGGTNLPSPSAATPSCNCGCPNQQGSLVQPKDMLPTGGWGNWFATHGSGNLASGPAQNSDNPVRYADGVATIAETDLHSDGFGFPWAQTRTWTNGPGYATNSDNGSGWVDTYIPHLLQADGSTNNTLILITNGDTAYYYDLVNGVYQPRIDDGSTLTHNSDDTYTLIDTSGDTIVLDGFGSSWLTAQRGQFASFTDPYGTQMAVTSYTSDGHVAEMKRSATSNGNTTTESWLYSYLPSTDPNADLLSGVTLRTQVNGGAWTIVRQVQYVYYDGTQQYGGNQGDLMSATVLDGSGNVLNTSYYRYYTQADITNGQAGYVHGLKYVFNPDSYARLTAALGTNLASLTDAQVAAYADNYFQYDSQQRVTQETVADAGDSQTGGGLGTYTFSYTSSGNTPDYNNWSTKTVVTNPDGSTDTFYTNFLAEVLLDDHYDPSSGLHTDDFYGYNSNAQLVLYAAPSAVSG
jgi:hypothetical protein